MSIYYKENPKYLNQCMESLAVQTLPATEIIIIKDGKLTDGLENILSIWKEKLPLKIEGYEKNRGLAHALNYGLQFCSHELVARMDSDDISMPDRFEKQTKYLSEHKNAVVVGATILEFYDGKKIKYSGVRNYPIHIDKKSKYLFTGTPLAHPTVIIRTEVLRKYRYNVNTSSNEDIDLWFRLVLDGYTINNLNDMLLKYRITDNTFSRRSYVKALGELKIYSNNLMKLCGFSYLFIFPLLRFISRLLPAKVIKRMYFSKRRQNFFMVT